jgi:hypothetical protein
MKKTITILLLTAICITVFTSCDLGNGLVAELLGDIKDVPVGEHIYPTDEYIPIETDIIMDIPIEPPVEIETTPPYEIETWEDWTYDVTVDIDIAYPDVQADFKIRSVECNYPDGTEFMETVGGDILGAEVVLRPEIMSVGFVGTAVLYDGSCTLGYRVDHECIFDDSFWGVGTDSEPEYRELKIEIPADQLTDGYNEISLIYESYGQIQEIGTIVVLKEVPTTEVEYPVDPEEVPEGNIDD